MKLFLLKLGTDRLPVGFFSEFCECFQNSLALTLRLYLQRDNIGLLNEKYNYKSEQKMVVLKRTGVYVWCEGLRLDKIGLLNLGEY